MPAKSEKEAVAARIAGAIKKGLQKPKPGTASAQMAKMPMKTLKKFQHVKGEKKVKKEAIDGAIDTLYMVKKPYAGCTLTSLVEPIDPLVGLEGSKIVPDQVHGVFPDQDMATQVAAGLYEEYCAKEEMLEEKKGKVGDRIKKTIDHLEKKRKEHIDMAKEDPKNAYQHKERIVKIAHQIDDLMSKLEKIEKSKKEIKKDEKKNLKEAFEVHFSDGVRQAKKFKDPKSALNFAKQLISTNKNLQNVDVFKAGPNFHSTADTDSVIAWWGDGSYMDNKSKKDAKLAAKKIK
jgi:valyl-tRNA synthetase